MLQTKPVLLQAGQLAIASDDFARGNRVAVLVGRSRDEDEDGDGDGDGNGDGED